MKIIGLAHFILTIVLLGTVALKAQVVSHDTRKVYKSLECALTKLDGFYAPDLTNDELKELPVEIVELKHLRSLELSKKKSTCLRENCKG